MRINSLELIISIIVNSISLFTSLYHLSVYLHYKKLSIAYSVLQEQRIESIKCHITKSLLEKESES